MPAILDRLVQQLKDKGHDEASAMKIAVKSLQRAGDLYPGTMTATPQGEIRGAMSPEQREKLRKAAKKRYINRGMKFPKIKF